MNQTIHLSFHPHGPDQQLQMNTRLHNLSPFCRNGLRVETLLAHEQYWLVSNLDRRIFSYPAPSH